MADTMAAARIPWDNISGWEHRNSVTRHIEDYRNAIPTKDELEKEVEDWKSENDKPSKVEKNRPNFYGAVPDVDVGTSWLTRVECCRDGIHRPTVAGIHGGQEGAYSIALSGGYDDNIDLGECFTYTGEGGRDLKGTSNNPKNLRTAPQSKDQTLSRGNLALSRSVETGNPVRVIRGYKLAGLSPFAPEEGYRYDGLYSVEKAWYTTGVSQFGVWKFALRRCEAQASPPWHLAETGTEEGDMNKENNNDENQSDRNEQVRYGGPWNILFSLSDRNEQNNNLPEKNNIDEGSEAKETDNKSDDSVPEENSPEPTDELETDITEDTIRCVIHEVSE